ncbi:hypothetical protein LXA43DRAFT_1022633 [Ganoderma leucocontextum]|nr:hypothetical protein LXA43DRAFT_1022633 [Ganoderma leucocontextum]
MFVILSSSALHVPFTQTSYITKFSEPINAMLISHFLLDLHEANHAKAYQECLSGMDIIGSVGSSFVVRKDKIVSREGIV